MRIIPDPKYLDYLKRIALSEIKIHGHTVSLIDKEDWDLIAPMLREYAISNPDETKQIVTGIAVATEMYNYYKPEDSIFRKKYTL